MRGNRGSLGLYLGFLAGYLVFTAGLFLILFFTKRIQLRSILFLAGITALATLLGLLIRRMLK
jgi:hypothetical protein